MRGKEKRRGVRGFTLAELLAAVGILTVLMAVAIPNVVSMRNDMNLIELDDTARQIFAVAQNRLIALRNGGQLADLPGTEMTAQPTDYPSGGIAWDQDFYYVTKTNAGDLLPPGSIDDVVRSNYYVIEYHRPSGMIYGVFYAKEPITYSSGMPRDRNERKHDFVGYYGGASIHYTAPPEETDTAQLQIINEERLSVRLVAEAQTRYQITVSGTMGEEATYTFAFDYNSFEMAAQQYPGQLSWRQEAGETIYELLLDGAPGEGRFQAFFPSLTPGADVEITVEATVIRGKDEGLPSVERRRVNSLFAEREEDAVLLLYGRHLQNLEPSISGVSGVTAARLADDITWTHEAKFTPIINEALTAFDGSGLILRAFDFGRNGSHAGLFGRYAGELTNLRLVDAKLDEPRADYAGLFIGRAEQGAKISSCYAYIEDVEKLEDYSEQGNRFVGGLIGEARRSEVQDCFASIPSISAAHSDGTAGGLVGRMEGGSMQRCYAASGYMGEAGYQGGVTANGSVGGLVGRVSGGSITDCYAVGAIGGTGSLGTLLGEATNAVMVRNAYAAVLSPNGAAQFAGGDVTLQNCYELRAKDEDSLPAEDEILPPEEGETLPEETTPTEGLQAVTAEELAHAALGNSFQAATEAMTMPYTMTGVYLYPQLKALPHYGDWPTEIPKAEVPAETPPVDASEIEAPPVEEASEEAPPAEEEEPEEALGEEVRDETD